jgi:hypothetical protein
MQNSHLPKLAVLALNFVCAATYANTLYTNCDNLNDFHPSAYIGGQIGYGVTDYGSKAKNVFDQFPTHSYDEDGVAGRVFLGYQFTPVIGLEAGYSLFSDNIYKSAGFGSAVKYRLETDAADLLAVVRTPFQPFGQNGPVLSVKGGAAYVMSHATLSGHITGSGFTAKGSRDNWEPEAGISLGYKLENNMLVDLSYQHIFGPGDIRSPKIDFASIGVTYKFA